MAAHINQTKRCPYCRMTYSNRTVSELNFTEKLIVFGPLFIKCRHFGQMFRDNDAVELVVMDPPKFYLRKFHLRTILLSTVFAGLGLFTLFSGGEVAAHPVALILMSFGLVAVFLFWIISDTNVTLQRSRGNVLYQYRD